MLSGVSPLKAISLVSVSGSPQSLLGTPCVYPVTTDPYLSGLA